MIQEGSRTFFVTDYTLSMSKKHDVLTLPGPIDLYAYRKKGQEHLVILTSLSYRYKQFFIYHDQVQNVPDFIIEKTS